MTKKYVVGFLSGLFFVIIVELIIVWILAKSVDSSKNISIPKFDAAGEHVPVPTPDELLLSGEIHIAGKNSALATEGNMKFQAALWVYTKGSTFKVIGIRTDKVSSAKQRYSILVNKSDLKTALENPLNKNGLGLSICVSDSKEIHSCLDPARPAPFGFTARTLIDPNLPGLKEMQGEVELGSLRVWRFLSHQRTENCDNENAKVTGSIQYKPPVDFIESPNSVSYLVVTPLENGGRSMQREPDGRLGKVIYQIQGPLNFTNGVANFSYDPSVKEFHGSRYSFAWLLVCQKGEPLDKCFEPAFREALEKPKLILRNKFYPLIPDDDKATFCGTSGNILKPFFNESFNNILHGNK